MNEQSIYQGFLKRAGQAGVNNHLATELFKQANFGAQAMDMFKNFRAQNPALVDAGIGAAAGAGIGSLTAGPENRGKGALIGAGLGAGIGGPGMHPELLQQLKQQFNPQQQQM